MISRTPKKLEQDTNNLFGSSMPTAQVFDDVDGEDAPSREELEKDKIAELEAQLRRVNEKLETRDSDLDYLQQPSHRSQTNEGPIIVDPKSVALPDPALDPDGFSNATQQRTQIVLENDRRRRDFDTRQKNDLDTKVADLWADFGDKYPEMAADKKRIDYIASQLAQDAARKGIDPQKYMFGTPNRFMKDVAKEYVSIFGEPETDDTDVDDDPPVSRRRPARAGARRSTRDRDREEESDGRSSGVFGGNDGSGHATRKVNEEDGPSMIDDLWAMQKKSGFF